MPLGQTDMTKQAIHEAEKGWRIIDRARSHLQRHILASEPFDQNAYQAWKTLGLLRYNILDEITRNLLTLKGEGKRVRLAS